MRWRIAAAYLLLILITLALLALISLSLLRATYLRTLENGVAGQARLLAALAATDARFTEDQARLQEVVQLAHERLDARVTLIASDGVVLADSLTTVTGASLRDRPEVREALARGQGASERLSTATGDDRLYVAVPIGPPGTPQGVVRVGVPLTTIAAVQAQLAAAIGVAALLAAGVTVILAVLIARRTTQPLLDLRVTVGRLAAGDLAVRAPIPSDAEVGALAQDINQMANRLRQVLDEIESERQRLAAVLATMTDGIVIVDEQHDVRLINRAGRALVPTAAALPMPLQELGLGHDLERAVDQAWSVPAKALPVIVNEIVRPPHKRSLRAIVTQLPMADSNHTLVALQDLTELRRTERMRRALLVNIAHDLRTPLTSIQAIVETLQDGAFDDRDAAPDFLRRMAEEVDGLARLVNEVLELAQIESGELTLHCEPTDIAALVRGVVSRMNEQALRQQLDLRLDLPSTPSWLTVDGPRIEQALLNMLQNAITFTPAGGTITAGVTPAERTTEIWVRDTGVGIEPADLPHIFERFYKADRARSSRGTGLGLAIVKHLVERHGGTVAAESGVGEGTTIRLSLPRSADSA
jgi:two-component system, OmpR family, phosphate regulon sensor histidine kinase PhoR